MEDCFNQGLPAWKAKENVEVGGVGDREKKILLCKINKEITTILHYELDEFLILKNEVDL